LLPEPALGHLRQGDWRQPLPRIDPWRDRLDGLLLANEGKPARERPTLVRVFEELRGLGYEGGYDAVRRYAHLWQMARGAATAAPIASLIAAVSATRPISRSTSKTMAGVEGSRGPADHGNVGLEERDQDREQRDLT